MAAVAQQPVGDMMVDTKPSPVDPVEDILTSLRSSPFHIQRLKEKFLDKALKDMTVGGSSTDPFGGGDGMMLDPTNPLLVDAELKGQKDYFKKLKFKYLEQEAKLEFLGSIMGDEPKILSLGENEEKERINAEKKAKLKETKGAIDSMRTETVALSASVSASHAKLLKDSEEAARMAKMVKEMELELARIRATHPPNDRLTTTQASNILDRQIEEMSSLDEQVQASQASVDATREEVSKIAKEVQRLGREKDREEARAKEARGVREGQEKGEDTVGELCRWYTAAIDLYRQLLGIKSIRAMSESELRLEYTLEATTTTRVRLSDAKCVTLALFFDVATKMLVGAQLINYDLDIEEAVSMAIQTNDVPGLVANVLTSIRNPKTV